MINQVASMYLGMIYSIHVHNHHVNCTNRNYCSTDNTPLLYISRNKFVIKVKFQSDQVIHIDLKNLYRGRPTSHYIGEKIK